MAVTDAGPAAGLLIDLTQVRRARMRLPPLDLGVLPETGGLAGDPMLGDPWTVPPLCGPTSLDRARQATFALWLARRIEVRPDRHELRCTLWADYMVFAVRAGPTARGMGPEDFAQALHRLAPGDGRTRSAIVVGLALRPGLS